MSTLGGFIKNRFWLGMTLGAVLGVIVTLAPTYLAGRDTPPLEPGRLVIYSSRDDSVGGQRQILIDQWNATHRENQAEIIELSPQTDAAHSQMVAHAQSKQPGVDIYNIDVISTAEFADADFIRPLDESTVDRKEFLRGPIETCVYQGKLWALPFNTDAGLLYYREDLVREPPVSWQQLLNTPEVILAKPHPNELEAGYAGQLARYEGLTVNALEAIQAYTRSDVVRDGKIAVSRDDIQQVIQWLTPKPPDQKGFVLRESLEHQENESTLAFRAGKVLFMRHWPIAHRGLEQPPDEQSAGFTVPFKVTTLPGSVLGGQNLAIAANTTKPRAAQALIEFLTDARSQQILFERGGLAATREVVYRDVAVRDQYPYVETLLEAIQTAKPRPVTPCYARFSEAFYTGVHQALRTRRPLPDDFIDTLNAALNC